MKRNTEISKAILLLAAWLLIAKVALAQSVSGFELKNVDGKMVSLASFSGKKAVVVIFSGNHCVYSKKYEDRIIALNNRYAAQGVQFLVINSNNPTASEEEKFEIMASRSKEKGYTFPYLQDPDRKVSKMFGATKNPEAYVMVPGAGGFNIVYHGNIDDNALMADKVTKHYLEDALNKVMGGANPDLPSTETVGCAIREM